MQRQCHRAHYLVFHSFFLSTVWASRQWVGVNSLISVRQWQRRHRQGSNRGKKGKKSCFVISRQLKLPLSPLLFSLIWAKAFSFSWVSEWRTPISKELFPGEEENFIYKKMGEKFEEASPSPPPSSSFQSIIEDKLLSQSLSSSTNGQRGLSRRSCAAVSTQRLPLDLLRVICIRNSTDQ